MKKIICILIVAFSFLSCGPRRLGCGPRGCNLIENPKSIHASYNEKQIG